MRDSEKILASEFDAVGPRNSARIWGFISKFVMLDRFMKTLDFAVEYPGSLVPRVVHSPEYFGTASKVISLFVSKTLTILNLIQILDEVNPPTKIIDKFLRTWGDRLKQRSIYAKTSSTPAVDQDKPLEITLILSRSLIAVVKVRNVLHIEAGLEMIALAMAISSKVCYDYILLVYEIISPIRITGSFQKCLAMSETFYGSEIFLGSFIR